MLYLAHIVKSENGFRYQTLEEHLESTAFLARQFSEKFGAPQWGYLAGLWHDLGKYSDQFQEKLKRITENKPDMHVDHSTYGAQRVWKLEKFGKIIAYAIAGHHSGLPDATGEDSSLQFRLQKEVLHVNETCIPKEILSYPDLTTDFLIRWFRGLSDTKRAFAQAFFIRMVYSSLVDADFLDTEKFMDPQRYSKRSQFKNISELRKIFIDEMEKFQNQKLLEGKGINKIRNEIYKACLEAAQQPQGIFSLTVPTGGGKTLSSLAFAFEHAIKHDLERIIYVIPYTSIIEQNAEVFKRILGNDAVIEHHSNYVEKDDDKEDEEARVLASENWDAPIIVTTNVQFFESLFSNRTSRARKIHNIAKSVVILDEAQMIPADYLYPSMEVLRELSSHYGTTIVLCTATQPALNKRENFEGLENVKEIISNPEKLAKDLKRVHEKYIGELDDQTLGQKIASEKQVLCIVNSRRNAVDLYKILEDQNDKEGNYHLSALMCPAHRSKVLKEIRQRLKNENTCRVVSTQLVEAGVDVDFPVVYRSLAGLDSIVQAAGRCNREGKLKYGDLFVYKPSKGIPAISDFRPRAEEAESIISQNCDGFLSLTSINDFFESYYWRKGNNLDKKEILRDFKEGLAKLNFPFKQISEKFRIIEDVQKPVFIPYDESAEDLINHLRYHVSIEILRKLQRYTVQIPERTIRQLQNAGYLDPFNDEFWTLTEIGRKEVYNEKIGLTLDTPEFYQVETTIL
ncbi:MAG: CRISPR-associated helicase Cas3' [Thermotogae bacterium]|jgi:CRISPR-associated endonuclease/helicase Cas3|nr:CRISPR-associated helicase Cas3' [Thermotogota bacterium]MCL5032194.1 CRISPR-associated helicase Cas3' [Thermotogota bacterium]